MILLVEITTITKANWCGSVRNMVFVGNGNLAGVNSVIEIV
jgi:hypothetical protein